MEDLHEKMQVKSHKMRFKFLSVAAGDFIFAYMVERLSFLCVAFVILYLYVFNFLYFKIILFT